MTPKKTADPLCYTRHGGNWNSAVDGKLTRVQLEVSRTPDFMESENVMSGGVFGPLKISGILPSHYSVFGGSSRSRNQGTINQVSVSPNHPQYIFYIFQHDRYFPLPYNSSDDLDAAPLAGVAATVPEDAAPPRGASAGDADGATAVGLVLAGNGVGTGEEGGSGDGDGSLDEVELHVLVCQLEFYSVERMRLEMNIRL